MFQAPVIILLASLFHFHMHKSVSFLIKQTTFPSFVNIPIRIPGFEPSSSVLWVFDLFLDLLCDYALALHCLVLWCSVFSHVLPSLFIYVSSSQFLGLVNSTFVSSLSWSHVSVSFLQCLLQSISLDLCVSLPSLCLVYGFIPSS